ncbi:MAG: TetR/AcrR family transcriptional regulator, partial [Chloroflexota bacterium]|nr:TetR/AcrR family transcriptional regulator [Chloroflexota bacterium]
PARTTIAEIARRAGVQRLTVYTHFPDDTQLILACQAHTLALLPPPDLSEALALDQAAERLRAVLTLMYDWYRKTEEGIVRVLQDRGTVPALDQVLTNAVDIPLAELAAGLAAGFGLDGRHEARPRAMTRLALDFWTWRCLKEEGLDDTEIVEAMTETIVALAARVSTQE